MSNETFTKKLAEELKTKLLATELHTVVVATDLIIVTTSRQTICSIQTQGEKVISLVKHGSPEALAGEHAAVLTALRLSTSSAFAIT